MKIHIEITKKRIKTIFYFQENNYHCPHPAPESEQNTPEHFDKHRANSQLYEQTFRQRIVDKGVFFNKDSINSSISELHLQSSAMHNQKRALDEDNSSHVNLSDRSGGQRSSEFNISVVAAAISPSSTVSTDMNGQSSTGQSPTLMTVAETDGRAQVNIGGVSDPQGSGRISCIFKQVSNFISNARSNCLSGSKIPKIFLAIDFIPLSRIELK